MRRLRTAAISCLLLLSACSRPDEPTPTPEPQATATPAPTSTPELNPPAGASVSPDGDRYIVVRNEGRLIVGERGGSEREIVVAEEILETLWFPDSQHAVYVDVASTDAENPSSYERVWIAALESNEAHAIASGFAPVLSPDGRYVAFIHGTRTGNACIVGYGLGIVELNESFVPVALIRQSQIAGIPADEQAHTFQPDVSQELAFPGSWTNETTLEVSMGWSCTDPQGDNGTYVIDVVNRQADKR